MHDQAGVHVLAHQRVRSTRQCCRQNVCVVKRQLVLLGYLHRLRVCFNRQGHNRAGGFDGIQNLLYFRPGHLELAMAYRCDFVEHLDANSRLLSEQGFSR